MRRSSLFLLPVLVVALIGCEDKPQPKPVASPKPTAPATKKPEPKKVEKTPEKKPDAKWVKYTGPKLNSEIGDAKQVWCVLPVSTGFNSLKFGYKNVKEVADDVVVVDGYVPSHVPNAFVHKPQIPKGLKKGSPIMVNEAAAGPVGRVVEAGDRIKYKYVFASSVSDGTLKPVEVWPLEGKVAFAEPVAYKDGDEWEYARVGYAGKDKIWLVLNSGGSKEVDASTVKPLDIKTIYKKGDAVWAQSVGRMKPAKVSEVLDEGVAYKVKFDEGDREETRSFAEVTKPFK